ncbi:MAG: hydrogenase nickel incorporation protein HypB [Phycisphaerales bacterium]|jgi:hydrogenase nickel incorporation protein HypB
MQKKVQVGKKILSANEEYAQQNRQLLSQQQKVCLNMISSPGSGKTSILARTVSELRDKISIGVVEGDIQTELDAERIRTAGASAVQINTEGACHLSAAQVNTALQKLPLEKLDLIIIENVGNLVCPSAFELGEDGKIAVLSVAEGDDKPVKYPALFSKSKVLLINKIDLLDGSASVDFDVDKVKADARKLNERIEIFCVSAKTSKGMNGWYDWLIQAAKA